MLNEANPPTSLCIRCGRCDGYPCLVHAKADADIIAVRPLLSRLNVTLLVNAEVRRLETDPRGRSVTKDIVRRGGTREEYSGDVVVLAAGAVNSAKVGTCRFGTDPEASVLDVNCKAHELDNLYVADAGFLPSAGAVGPALTVMANAIRVGEHLVHRLR